MLLCRIMIIWDKSAAGHDMLSSVSLLFKSGKVILNQQYGVQQAAWSMFLSNVLISYSHINFLTQLQSLSPFYAKIKVLSLMYIDKILWL